MTIKEEIEGYSVTGGGQPMPGNTHITDRQVEEAARRMRQIIEAAENSNQAGEDALIRADHAGDLYNALERA
ncbi:MAG TPA: hypothetical protein VKA19_13050 [Alphaproteobacteria bacterium]|nr:hypothetical protein [Alphaproteobacteria bacterium]